VHEFVRTCDSLINTYTPFGWYQCTVYMRKSTVYMKKIFFLPVVMHTEGVVH